MRRIKYSKVYAILIAVLISVVILVFRDEIENLKSYGYIGLFLLNTLGSATLFLPTPLFLTAVAASAFLNPILVTLISSVGSAIGELTGYLTGYGGREVINDSERVLKLKGWLNKYGAFTIFILGAIPNPIFDVAGILAGTMGMPVYKFLIAVWFGKLIKFAFLALIGVNIGNVL